MNRIKFNRLRMKRILLANITLICAINIYSQLITDTIFYDNNWQQSDPENASYYRIVSSDTSGKIQYLVKDYYMSEHLQMTGTYKSISPDYKTGTFKYWYENGQCQLVCSYVNNKLDGEYFEYYDNGRPKNKKNYKNGLLDGTEKSWSSQGLLAKVVEYKDGVKHGRFLTYYDNGQLIRKDIYRNNKFVKGNCYTREGKDTSYFNYFIMPKFKGGLEGFKRFILDGIKYPEIARQNREEGQVYLKFTVDKEGNVIKAKIIKADKEYFNEEVMRVLKLSPKWIPGRKDGKLINVTITIPISFKIH
jgi:TonB family protein